MAKVHHLAVGLLVLSALAACAGDIVPPGPAPHVRISGGNGQSGVALDTLALPLEVTVVNDAGEPVPGRTVTWMSSGGGDRLLPIAPVTDGDGRARAVWILGPDSGEHEVSAVVTGEDGAVEFTATASEVAGLKAIALMHGSTSTVGQPHMCALAADSLAWCWGGNAAGTLGDGTTISSTVPVQVLGGRTFASIHGEGFNTCGLRRNGELWCWGQNAARVSIFGNGPTDEASSSPVRAAQGLLFRDFDLEASFACGVTTDGRAWCWGDGDGASGTAGTGSFAYPSEIVGDRRWLEISVSDDGRCAVAEDQRVYCWFDPDFDRWTFIGVPDDAGPDDMPLPVEIVGPLTELSLGEFGACGLSLEAAGTGVCWGFGAALDPPGPAHHRLGSSVRKIASDGFARAALDAQGQLWIWNGGCCNLAAGRTPPVLLFPGVEWSDVSLATGLHVISARDSIAFSLGPIPESVNEASFELVPVPRP
ncbi:MAG TPA: hypothetical protein VFT04_11795 [Gemmatimonadales bacterium]|nr:hypothetical protein [Gemmatimonadales bacterium]